MERYTYSSFSSVRIIDIKGDDHHENKKKDSCRFSHDVLSLYGCNFLRF